MGAITEKELERQIRIQIEAVVFELLSWREGFFRFEEGPMQGEPMVQIGTEALLMEGARRIDEWSRISDRVPSLLADPAPHVAARTTHAPMLDLLPSEWEVLTMIDGELDLRAIAANLARTEFDTAKVVYGLVSTGVVELDGAERDRRARRVAPLDAGDPDARGRRHADAGARVAGRDAADADPVGRRGAQAAPAAAPVADGLDDLERGFQYVLRGDFDGAVVSWATWLQSHPTARHDGQGARRARGGRAAARHRGGALR